LGLRRNRQRPCRKSAKRHRHRGDGGLHGLGRPPGIREGGCDVGLTDRAKLRPTHLCERRTRGRVGETELSPSASIGQVKGLGV
jgi:hypothetical protein